MHTRPWYMRCMRSNIQNASRDPLQRLQAVRTMTSYMYEPHKRRNIHMETKIGPQIQTQCTCPSTAQYQSVDFCKELKASPWVCIAYRNSVQLTRFLKSIHLFLQDKQTVCDVRDALHEKVIFGNVCFEQKDFENRFENEKNPEHWRKKFWYGIKFASPPWSRARPHHYEELQKCYAKPTRTTGENPSKKNARGCWLPESLFAHGRSASGSRIPQSSANDREDHIIKLLHSTQIGNAWQRKKETRLQLACDYLACENMNLMQELLFYFFRNKVWDISTCAGILPHRFFFSSVFFLWSKRHYCAAMAWLMTYLSSSHAVLAVHRVRCWLPAVEQ